MSDTWNGPGWWLASDGKWYPPDLHPEALASKGNEGSFGSGSLPTFDVAYHPSGDEGRPTDSMLSHPPPVTGSRPESFVARIPSTSRSWRTGWLKLVGALVVLAAVVTTVVVLNDSGSASGWDDSLHVVGGPVASGQVAVVLNVNPSHELEISGIQPTNGSVLWSYPFSASAITPGVAFLPIAIGSTVLVATPASGTGSPLVRVEGVESSTGKVLWTISQPVVLSDAPVVCAAGRYFCLPILGSPTTTGLLAVDPSTGKPVGSVLGPARSMAVAPLGTTNDSALWETSDSTPTFVQTSSAGQKVWTASVASLFGGKQYDPDYGWDFLVKGPLDIGSVGIAPTGNTLQAGSYKTIGISVASGSVEWSVPGYYMCGGGLQFISVDLVCRFSGSFHHNGSSVTTSGLNLTLEGLDASRGTTTWSERVLNAKALSLGTNVAFTDGTHVVVQLPSKERVLLNAQNGSVAPVSSNQLYWCEQVPMFKVNAPSVALVNGKRASQPVFKTCSASGSPESGQPSTTPSFVGLRLDGRFIWPTPTGLKAIPSSNE